MMEVIFTVFISALFAYAITLNSGGFMGWGIPRSSWDYSWGRKIVQQEEPEIEIQQDVSRDYCPVCDKKSVIFQGQCLSCARLDDKNNS